jgi:hypothetical protein
MVRLIPMLWSRSLLSSSSLVSVSSPILCPPHPLPTAVPRQTPPQQAAAVLAAFCHCCCCRSSSACAGFCAPLFLTLVALASISVSLSAKVDAGSLPLGGISDYKFVPNEMEDEVEDEDVQVKRDCVLQDDFLSMLLCIASHTI